MFLQITDVAQQVLYVRHDYVVAVIMPSLLTQGQGAKHFVVFVGGTCEVTRPEAERLLETLNRHAESSDLARLAAMASHGA